jgi:hypothetical protein
VAAVTDSAPKAEQVAVTPAAHARSTLPRIDYEDAFVIGSRSDVTAVECARAALEGASTGPGRALWSALATIGVLPRASGGREVIAGWAVRRSGPDLALLAAEARIGLAAELLFERQRDRLLWATFVQLDTALARVAWAALAPVHRRVVVHLLERVD